MILYVIRRLLLIIPTLLGVMLVIFTINYFIDQNADPAKLALGTLNLSAEEYDKAYQAKRTEMGLDQPFVVRYARYVWGVVTRLDLGNSYDTTKPVAKEIFEGRTFFESRLGITIKVGILSCILTIVLGVGIGILSAVKKYSILDYTTTTLAVVFSAMPAFWAALMALVIFCKTLGWFPGSWDNGSLKGIVLPVVCMALSPIAIVVRMTRTSMLDVINQDYIRTARAKGVAERVVIFSHALRNALIPVLTIIGMQLTMVVGGSFIIEQIFSIPGIGKYLLEQIGKSDYPVIQGTVLILSFFVCIINLLVDLAYAFADPRIMAQYRGAAKWPKKLKAKQEAA